MRYNIVIGSSGLVGSSFFKYFKKKKNYIFFSRTGNNFKKLDLDNKFFKIPFKEVDNCFFFSSPRIIKKNFVKKNFKNEYIWLKKLIKNVKIQKLVYLSSSSVYYNKNHVIGSTKIKCEKYILKNKRLFKNYQIWRPFNLIGNNFVNSIHFHNHLFKVMFIDKKRSYIFSGNSADKRGYADVNHFVKLVYKNSRISKSFTKNYGNKNLIKISQIYELFNKYYKKYNKKDFKIFFRSNKSNVNSIKSKKNCVYYNKKSLILLKRYLVNSIYEKKM